VKKVNNDKPGILDKDAQITITDGDVVVLADPQSDYDRGMVGTVLNVYLRESEYSKNVETWATVSWRQPSGLSSEGILPIWAIKIKP